MNRSAFLLAAVVFIPAFSWCAEPAVPKTGLSYIPNHGQWPAAVKYRAEANGLAFFAETGGITWSKLQDDFGERLHERQHMSEAERASFQLRGHAWRMGFSGADPNAELIPAARKSHVLSYFLGNDPQQWARNVPAYAALTYQGLWPGIDLQWYGDAGRYKYDLLLAPGSECSGIGFLYEGLDGQRLNVEGNLVLETSVGEVTELRPVANYGDGAHEAIACSFTITGDRIGFTLDPNADHTRPIVIDPLLIASTLSGTGDLGITENYGHTATYDGAGNIYTGAICFGQGYPQCH